LCSASHVQGCVDSSRVVERVVGYARGYRDRLVPVVCGMVGQRGYVDRHRLRRVGGYVCRRLEPVPEVLYDLDVVGTGVR